MIISFSGLDGAGKTTQIKRVLNAYKNQGAKVGSIYSFVPDIRYHNVNELCNLYENLLFFDVIHIRFRLNSDRNNMIMQKLESRLPKQRLVASAAAIQGCLDHKELTKFLLKPLLNKKKILIFDRYYYDELVFKSVYGAPKVILEMLYQNEKDADLGFILRITSDECVKRNRHRPDSKMSIYQSQSHIDSLINCFDCIAKRKGLITLDGALPEERITKKVMDHIYQFNNKSCQLFFN